MLVTGGATLVDRYLVEDRLGHGGMGCVWRARDLVLGRQVAIKLTDRAGAGRGAAERRLRREAMVISSLTDRRLARVYDYFETRDGSFIVMELVRGESLSQRIKREGRLPLAEAVWIVAECAEALHSAHRAGVVHRDVKPSNIMLTESAHAWATGTAAADAGHVDADTGIMRTGPDVKIVDFGIAARTRPAARPGSRAEETVEAETETMTGHILGTIAYLAPERVSGAPDSPAADLYSLGVVFYQLLSGRLPFEAAEPIAVLCAHADGRAAPLPADVPPPVAELCFRLMARDPADRPPSGAAAAAELRALEVERPERLWPRRGAAGPQRTRALVSFPWRQDGGPRAGRQVKALIAAASLATMATAGCTAWLVTGFGTQAAGSPQQTVNQPAAKPATSTSSPSGPHSAQPVSVVGPVRSSSPAQVTSATQSAAHRAARAGHGHGKPGGGGDGGGGDGGGDGGGGGGHKGGGPSHGNHGNGSHKGRG